MASVTRISGTPLIKNYYQASGGAANDWSAGDLVKIDTNGAIVIATSGANWGIAQKAAPGDTTTAVPVDVLFADGSEFVMKYKASATGQGIVGEHCQITYTVGAHTADNTGTGDVVILELDPRDPVTTSGGRLIVSFMAAGLQTNIGQ